MRCHQELLTVAVRLARSIDDGPDGGGAETFSLSPSIDGEVPHLAVVSSMCESEHADCSPLSVTDEERLPPTSAWTDETLRQNHKRNRLVIGHERQLLIVHAHLERLSPVTRVDQLKHDIRHRTIQSPQQELRADPDAPGLIHSAASDSSRPAATGCPNSGQASLRHSYPCSGPAKAVLAGCPQFGHNGAVTVATVR